MTRRRFRPLSARCDALFTPLKGENYDFLLLRVPFTGRVDALHG